MGSDRAEQREMQDKRKKNYTLTWFLQPDATREPFPRFKAACNQK